MRKMICLLGVLLICMTLACPVFAASDTFVPSITYKDGPEIEDAKLNEEDVSGCVIVSSIADAEKKTTDITQEARDELLDVYAKLSDGSMELPLEDGYVIRELVDVSFKQTACIEAGHTHKEELDKEGTTITIDFDLGVKASTEVEVLSYHDGQWAPIVSVENNGDGTVTCVFEHFCPVVFCVDAGAETVPPQTGDAMGTDLILWSLLLLAALIAMVCLLVSRRKSAR